MYKIKLGASWVTGFLNEETHCFATLESAIQRAKLESESHRVTARIYKFYKFTSALVWTYHNLQKYRGEL